jgi:hypothetical protein
MNRPNLVPLEVMGISSDGKFSPVLLLRHEDRLLPIFVGIAEADAILAALENRKLGRPMTHDLIVNLLAGLRGELQSIVIYKLEDDTFYAHLNVEQKSGDDSVEQVLRIDARPSDSVAVACRVGCPIFAAQEVMDQASADWSIFKSEDDAGDDEPGGADDEGTGDF